jgi:hypothetical protein
MKAPRFSPDQLWLVLVIGLGAAALAAWRWFYMV